MATIRIKGMAELNRKLDRIERGLVGPTMRNATQKAVLYVHSQVPPYPAPRPAQTYRRTGGLGRSITTAVKELGTLIIGIIGTAYKNAAWVISRKRVGMAGPQAWMHKGRWWTLQDVVYGSRDGIKRIYQEAVRSLIRG